MAATLATAPPVQALSGDGIYCQVDTDLIVDDYSNFELTFTGSPVEDDTLILTWPGGDVTFTAKDAPTGDPTEWPVKPAAQTLADYVDDCADFLRAVGLLNSLFTVSRDTTGGEKIIVKRLVNGAFDLDVTNDFSNVTVTANDAAGAAPPDNLRAVVKVHALPDPNAGAYTADETLLTTHGNFTAAASAVLDIHAAFAHLRPWLPADSSIILPAAPPPSSWYSELAATAFQQYRIRYGERYGIPAVIGYLISAEDTFSAILGAHSGQSITPDQVNRICHDYTRRDGAVFRKPVSMEQPDWVYVWTGDFIAADIEASLSLVIRWSDGTTSNYTPFGSGMPTLTPRGLYVFATGYRQLRLSLVAPTGATDPDAYIVGYTVHIGPQDDSFSWLAEIEYDVEPLCHPWNIYLAFTTGYGGIETCWLRGRATETYPVEAEEFQRARWGATRPAGFRDFENLNPEGRPAWEASTGWYSDDFYPVHLRQLPMAQCWMIDMATGRFLPVTVQSTDSPVTEDDETLHQLNFKIKAGWYDDSATL